MNIRLIGAVSVLLLTLSIPPAAQAANGRIGGKLGSLMSSAGRVSGAWVYNATDKKSVFKRRASTKRILASNQKLFTTAAALDRWGAEYRVQTAVYGTGALDGSTWRGDLYLKGFGDPTLATEGYARRHSWSASTRLTKLSEALYKLGIRKVSGRVYGDESHFDSRRGVPSSNYLTSAYVGPLSALALNTGHKDVFGRFFQRNPPKFAADRFSAILGDQGIKAKRTGYKGATPADAEILAQTTSPTLMRLVRRTNLVSDNYFAEMLTKGLGAGFGGKGSTGAGAAEIKRFADEQGLSIRVGDGSGLSRRDRASPQGVGQLLLHMRESPEFDDFYRTLPLAGRSGTLRKRMRQGAARGRLRAKTGTINGVSSLSGYVKTRSGKQLVFSILMNGVSTWKARQIQDRMADTMARY